MIVKTQTKQLIGITAAALALWAGQAQAQQQQRQITWPGVGSEWLQEGTFVNIENLKQMAPGLQKDQIHDLLGRPHFTTGMWGVKEWDYLFNFRTGRGSEYITCQYKVLFDNDYRAESLYWREGTCAQFLMAQQQPKPVAVAPAPAPAPVLAPVPAPVPVPQPVRSARLGADGLFRFAGGKQEDLLPQGRARIEALIADIRRDVKTVQGITITGHTDRIGSPASNDALSLQRAQTVRDMFVRGGFDVRAIRAVGAGQHNPVAQCQGTRKTPELIRCLQPNRRVEIEVLGLLS
jgi:outer membrane protein OmpA-like peptidoglycan-associated protein